MEAAPSAGGLAAAEEDSGPVVSLVAALVALALEAAFRSPTGWTFAPVRRFWAGVCDFLPPLKFLLPLAFLPGVIWAFVPGEKSLRVLFPCWFWGDGCEEEEEDAVWSRPIRASISVSVSALSFVALMLTA